jgi:DNA modification methylase
LKPYFEEDGQVIYHGDCRELLPRLSADLICTDPPYGLGAARRAFGGAGVVRHMSGLLAGKAVLKRDYGDSDWDDEPAPGWVIHLMRDVSKFQIIWGGNYFPLPEARCWLLWDKLRGDTDYADGEMAWTNLDKAVRIIRHRWNGFLQEPGCEEERWHPTQKPLNVMQWAIQQVNGECHTILDPYMGSGTTLLAAKNLGKTAIGIEREEKYCEIAAKRLSQKVLNFETTP